ncbi:multicopper oxidase domain-containing protein [Kordiimonas pumila]|uniref:Multicopper oxidase domain-containing protein n=1 Tax=Kordiimonas pumila TaxID=2161677 RepID=A0ABV7D121_9PROT|nr:multicopper oxidase domain-containing protein [Kordiimonas pumila]
MKYFFKTAFLALLLMAAPLTAHAKIVEYELDIDTATVNFTGKPVEALTVGGGIPAPLITARVGDTLRVTFHNKLNTASSIHWHGVLLPNEQDGVSFLTTTPIAAKSSHTFEYPIKHKGTFWYHSHTGLQEQRGVYGPIVFYPETGEEEYTEKVVVLSDWTDENPHHVLANIKKDGDYYALKKDSVQSWGKVIAHGWSAVKNRLSGAWTRMGPMDISDVGYDAFLANGQRQSGFKVSHGSKVKLRIVNAAASSYFNIEYAGGPMTIVAADGVDVQPVKVQRIRHAIAETYDVIIDAPHRGAAEFRATSEDGTGYASIFIGPDPEGTIKHAPDIPKPDPFAVDHSMHGGMEGMDHGAMEHSATDSGDMAGMDHAAMGHTMPQEAPKAPAPIDHSKMDHAAMGHTMPQAAPLASGEPIPYMTDYEPLKSVEESSLTAGRPEREVVLTLTGNMERYVWGFDGKTLLESDKILIKRGENVRFVLKNDTMMHHPVHLHGHFFRVITSAGAFSPVKHTVNVPPMGQVIIEFEANEEKDWFFHCHNLYHMKTGMARVISYEGSSTYNDATRAKLAANPWFYRGDITATNAVSAVNLRMSNTRNAFEADFDYGFDEKGFEGKATYERSINKFFDLYGGVRVERHEVGEPTETRGILGAKYVLPLLIEAEVEIDSKGDITAGFESELQLTKRLKFEWEWEYDFSDKEDEYTLALSYELSKRWLITARHDKDHGTGAGIRVKF